MAKAGSAKGKRLHAQAVARRAAAAVEVPDRCDVLVVGAGASGCAAAIAAADAAPNATVVLLDAASQAAKPVLATGNGRCNISNTHLDPARYNDPEFVASVFGPAPEERVQRWFRDLGLLLTEEVTRWDTGRLYPASGCATSVQGVLLNGLAEKGVVVGTLRPAVDLEPAAKGWCCAYEERFRDQPDGSWTARTLTARTVVLAPGAPSPLPELLGLPLEPYRPMLCSLAAHSPLPALWDGHRAECALELRREGRAVARERGEVLFRPGSLSGIAAMNLSRLAEPGDTIALELVSLGAPELEQLLGSANRRVPGSRSSSLLDGLVDPVIGATLVDRCGRDVQRLVSALLGLELPVTGLANTTHAQVQRGGVRTSAIDPATMALIPRPGLYACGEVLDVDGACGGYNLAFGWLSGLKAGIAAAQAS